MSDVYCWTNTAVECLERKCKCEGCFFENYFSGQHKCQMKTAVGKLLKKFGIPEQLNFKGFKKFNQKMFEPKNKEKDNENVR